MTQETLITVTMLGKGLACNPVLVYYIGQMDSRIKYALRVSILVFYCIYAVSPVYLTSVAGRNDWLTECGHQEMDVTCGIVWINVLLSKLVVSHQYAPTTPSEMTSAEHDRGFILVKKQRAVLRESVQIKPDSVQQADGSSTDVPPAVPPVVRRTLRIPQFRYEDFYRFTHAGPSPPLSVA
jgi:hypothetical protein